MMPVGIRILEQTRGNVLALEVCEAAENQYQAQSQPFKQIEALFEKTERLNFLLLVREVEGWSLNEFWLDLHSRKEYYSKLNRIAVVGDGELQNVFARISSGPDEKYFDVSRLDDAWKWVTDQDHHR